MTDQELLSAIEKIVTPIKSDLVKVREEIKLVQEENAQRLEARIKEAQIETMRDVATLIDAQFLKQFNLLSDKLESVMVKMPSEDDMDIIDGQLQEHETSIKLLAKDVDVLKTDVEMLKAAL